MRRGSALIASLMVVMVVSGLGMCLIRLHCASTRRQVEQIDRKRAFYVAEAGLSESFLAIAQGKSGNVGSEEVPAQFGAGVYWVVASPTSEGNVELESTGLCGAGRFSLSIVLRPHIDPISGRGVFSGTDLVVEPDVVIDGYDSTKGTYEEQVAADGNEANTDGGAMLVSNEDIHLQAVGPGGAGQPPPSGSGPVEGESVIYGDVHPGPSGSIIAEPGVHVTGSTTPSNYAGVMPEVRLPELVEFGQSWSLKSGQTVTFTRREGRVGRFSLLGGGTLVLSGPTTLVVGTLTMASGSTLVFDSSNGPVTLVVTERLEVSSGASFQSNDKDPRGVSLIVTASEGTDTDGDGVPDPPVVLEPSGEFHGFLYAPNAQVELPDTLRFFGAVAAQGLVLRSGFRMSVDRSLIDGQAGDGTMPKFRFWRIVALPDTPLVSARLDPRGLLSLQGVTPIPSDKAHAENNVQIDYFDALGKVQTYTGASSGMTWSDVNSVISVDWY